MIKQSNNPPERSSATDSSSLLSRTLFPPFFGGEFRKSAPDVRLWAFVNFWVGKGHLIRVNLRVEGRFIEI